MDILIIDDEIRRMNATVQMLRADGFSVEQINSPTKAVKRLESNPGSCKVIILDIMMPPDGEFTQEETDLGLRTGILILDRLQRIQGFNTPIIVLTANVLAKAELDGRVSIFLEKPVAYAKLKAAISGVFVA